MEVERLFEYGTKWPVASEYIIEDGYIKPHPNATFEYRNLVDYVSNDDVEPIHLRLANLYEQPIENTTAKISMDKLMQFVCDFGLFGLGRRVLLVESGNTLSDVKVLIEPGLSGNLHKERILLKSDPLPYKKIQDPSSLTDDLKATILIDFSPKPLESGDKYFPFFFPDKKVQDIALTEESFWRNYAEPIGNLEELDLLPMPLNSEITSKLLKRLPETEALLTKHPKCTFIFYFRDTLAHHITRYALAFRKSIESPRWPHPDSTNDDPYTGRIGIEQQMGWGIDALIRPIGMPIAYRVQKLDRFEWLLGFEFASLLDFCYWLLIREVTSGIRIIQCPWCGKINKLRENAPHNAAYCPPIGKVSQSCSHRYSKLKSYQLKIWNKFLMNKYGEDIKKLESSWGMNNLLKKKEHWFTRGKYAVPHPMDLAANRKMTIHAKNDYLIWRNSKALKNPKNNRILKDEEIVGSKQKFEIRIKNDN